VKRIRKGVEVDTSNSFLAELPTTLNKKTDGVFVFDYKFWAVFGEELRFFPSSSLLLFYPSHVDASVTSDSCPPPVTPFVARPGLFLKGKVTPAVGNTLIQVLNEANEVLIETDTKEDGTYAAGPLYDDKKYQVTAERENYKFVPADDKGLNFLGKKLGSIKVTLQDQDTKEALQGVLVSLSGGDGYRSNSMTQQGAISFSNLYPGSYFLRLALKEYSFIPPTKSIQVEDGEDVVVAFQAKRVAFSVYGSVKTLNGEVCCLFFFPPPLFLLTSSSSTAREISHFGSFGTKR
jgi:hypothetical protein